VRLPGERGMKLLREQLERGVLLHPTILPSLAPWAAKFGVSLGSVSLGSEP
jgi:L-lactate dehydrogenase